MSENHKCEAVRITELSPHFNADNLEVATVFSYNCCVTKGKYKVGDLVCFIPPESVVNVNIPEFSFLKKGDKDTSLIRVRKIRDVVSQGLIIDVPEFANEGDDLAAYFEVVHYQPEEEVKLHTDNEKGPGGYWEKYDIHSAHKYNRLFGEGEPVYITEKINGSNYRCCFRNGKMYVGSRTYWKAEDCEENHWWKVLTPNMRKFCEETGLTLYGEMCGHVKKFKYWDGKTKFLAFDIAKPDWSFVNSSDFLSYCKNYEIDTVPLLNLGHPFNFQECKKMAEGKSILNPLIVREGIVIKPMIERRDSRLGRVFLKLVGNDYLGKSPE